MRVMFYWTRGLYLSFKFNCVIVHVASHSTRVMTSPRCRVSTKQVLQATHRRSRSFTTCPIFTRIPSPLPSSAVFTTGFIGCHLHPRQRCGPSPYPRTLRPFSSAWRRDSEKRRVGIIQYSARVYTPRKVIRRRRRGTTDLHCVARQSKDG